MAFIQFSGLALAFGDRDIIKNGSFFLKSGCKTALCGANGSGKSTLLKIIAGELAPDAGERSIERGCKLSYLPQSGIVHRGKTLFEEAETAYQQSASMLAKAEEISALLLHSKDDDANTRALLAEQHTILQTVEASGYYQRKKNIGIVLSGLGFKQDDIERNTEEFSGGWQMRIALAKVLLADPDILLLDEPTNYLDIEARAWLETFLQNYKGAFVLVSHDRYFLDVTINEVYELFQGKLTHYAGNYSDYLARRAIEMESLLAAYKAQQEEIRKNEDLIRRFRYKASKAAMAQERIKKLEKMEIIEIPESLKKIDIAIPPPPHCGNIALTIEGIEKKFGDRTVLSGVNLTLEAGERLLVVGVNGAGKTTLLGIIAGADTDFAGNVRYGAGVCAGYFTQDSTETIAGGESVLEYLEASAQTALVPKLRDMLGAFLFRGDDVYKSLDMLSGGEKSRLALLRLLLFPLNLLILDEPTNHLDMHSQDVLLSALSKWQGTIIFVSHDRSFMEALSTKTLELTPKGTNRPSLTEGKAESALGTGGLKSGAGSRLFYGNYAYYIERVQTENETGAASSTIDAAPAAPLKNNSAHQFREEQKKTEAARRRLEKEEQRLIAEIEMLEKEKRDAEHELSQPEVYTSGERVQSIQHKIHTLNAQIEEATARWEALG
ncbi:MAG: ATP-binding cassette domain-containing protein [Spirochaetaceae bacterium]|jgi:ATP-binding cassette subfamily F protein 3|nr:ATP-binding cassette domain-containing protein [Spirochaetaceae bacterium]